MAKRGRGGDIARRLRTDTDGERRGGEEIVKEVGNGNWEMGKG